MAAARAFVESLLRARKLDVTLTTSRPWEVQPEERVVSSGVPAVDGPLGGGWRRGHLSEIVGLASAGRQSILCGTFAAATMRGEVVALIDTADRFDPASASAAGVDLARMLWVRDHGDALRALKALNLVLQAGHFGVVAFDLADVSAVAIRQFPYTTWTRLARVIEGTQTAVVLIASERISRSPGGATVSLEPASGARRGDWAGASHRSRFLRALPVHPRVISAR
jgi:hypothetical protein